MSLQIYKKGQGYWTRMMTAIAVGLLVVMGGVWLWDSLEGVRIGNLQPIYFQAGAFVLVTAIFGLLGYYLIGCKPKFVDFLIATGVSPSDVLRGSGYEIAPPVVSHRPTTASSSESTKSSTSAS